MKDDSKQEHLHRILASAADLDNEKTVAEHLEKVFTILIEKYPNNALEKLEEVSYLIRNDLDLSSWLRLNIDRDYRNQAKDQEEFVKKTMPMFVKPKAEEEDAEPPEVPPTCNI